MNRNLWKSRDGKAITTRRTQRIRTSLLKMRDAETEVVLG
ncbi:hypothetical protein VP455E521_P0069 [Vibrio phage 455E52-1]|nr:hypothetical protein VP455E521_P0069 [Vibrio phage 455E52-1]